MAGSSAGAASGGADTAGGGSGHGESGGSVGDATGGAGGEMPAEYVPISFGTALEPTAQMAESQALAKSLANPTSPTWRAKGDQRRKYHFPAANEDVPYRLCVPSTWDGTSSLPLVMFLHGAYNDESSYLDQNDKQMIKLAEQHGFVLVSALGHQGAYGNFLRLNSDFGHPEAAEQLIAMRTPESVKLQELSEKDVINVLELVLNEYPIDRARVFLTGHSMGSGGTWYIGGKYSTYFAALAPMSGPFVLEKGYPWENLRDKPVFVTEGLSAPSLNTSRLLRDWMEGQGLLVTYKEVNADHAGMVPLVLPDVFTFFAQVN